MLRIEVKSAEVKEDMINPSDRPGAKQFKPFLKRTQQGYVQLFNDNGAAQEYPRMFRISLDKEQPPYPIGVYMVDQSSFYVDRNDNLTLGKLRLLAQRPAAAKAA